MGGVWTEGEGAALPLTRTAEPENAGPDMRSAPACCWLGFPGGKAVARWDCGRLGRDDGRGGEVA